MLVRQRKPKVPASVEQCLALADYDAHCARVDTLIHTAGKGCPLPRAVLLDAIKACGESFAQLERVNMCEGKVSERTMEAWNEAFWRHSYYAVQLARCLPNNTPKEPAAT